MSDSKGKKPIDPRMFDGMLQFAAKAGNEKKADEPDLEYPAPEGKEQSTEEKMHHTDSNHE